MRKKFNIPDYQIHLPPLGEGAFGTVYRATYRGISERALKLFKPDKVDLSTMARELEKLSSVTEHHGIVTLHDFDLLGDTPHYAMGLHADENEDGTWSTRTLQQVCGKVDARESWRYLGEIAEAVGYLHRHHIIHCDLKPSNILLTDETPQRVKICDFGQSRGDRFSIDDIGGTPLYSSPEHLRKPTDSADGKGFRWDVYSFGVVAYRLITGEFPRLQSLAEAENPTIDLELTALDSSLEATIGDSESVDNKHIASLLEQQGPIKWPPWLRMPQERRELIERCLSLDPNERFADMREVRGAMEQIEQQARVRRSTRLNGVFAILLVFAIWASGFALIQVRRAKEASAEAMKSRDQARDLVLLVADKLSLELSQSGQAELISYISENTEAFLENLADKDKRASRTLLQFSASNAEIKGEEAEQRSDYPAAIQHYRDAFDIHSQLSAANPGDKQMQNEAASDLMQIGRVAQKLADYPTAIQSFEASLEINLASRPADQPFTPEQLRRSHSSLDAITETANAAGDTAKAANAIERNVKLHTESLMALGDREHPDRQLLAERLLRLKIDLGQLQIDSQMIDEARNTFTNALRNVADHPSVENLFVPDAGIDEATPSEAVPPIPLSYVSDSLVADTLSGMGQVQLELAEPEQALNTFNEELKIRRREADLRPLYSKPRIALATSYSNIAHCFDIYDESSRSLAQTSLERALAELRRLPPEIREQEDIAALELDCRDRIVEILELIE